jgi:hypothetical protein
MKARLIFEKAAGGFYRARYEGQNCFVYVQTMDEATAHAKLKDLFRTAAGRHTCRAC